MGDRASTERPIRYAWTTPPDLAAAMADGATIDVLYVHLPFGRDIEANFGIEGHQHFMEQAAWGIRRCVEDRGRPFGIQQWPVDDLVLWLGDWPEPTAGDCLEQWLDQELRRELHQLDIDADTLTRLSEVTIAHQRLPSTGISDPLRSYARALHHAQRGACDPAARERQRSALLLERAIRERAFIFHYQPIVDVTQARVIAHEALCRGTLDALRFPDVIFSAAERTNKLWDLGRVLRDLIAACLERTPPTGAREPLLFLNVHPSDLDDPAFLEQALSGPLAANAHRIVVELTERAAIRDYRRVKAFFATLRRHGYQLAIDDLGSGYAGLTSLAELEPDFIKFDMGLIRDLHLHPVKQRLIERMQEFAVEIGSQTISEGVECAEERDALLRIGCKFMQGYFFARPAPTFVDVPAERFPKPPYNARSMVG